MTELAHWNHFMSTLSIEKAKELAANLDIKADFFIHAASGKTTEQASVALGISPEDILKILVLHAPIENKYIGVIILGSEKLSIKKLTQLSHVKKLLFANVEQVEKLTGFVIGGVPATAIQDRDERFMDAKVVEKQLIVGAGGDDHCGMRFSPKELAVKLNLTIDDVAR